MLDGDFEDGINTSQYHKVAKVSKPTASRHLAALVELGCLVKTGAGGRSTRYVFLVISGFRGELSIALTHFCPIPC
ncbi:hypothetical protein A6E03_16685 [Aliivibrio sp. 1S128]|nr:hypothetical protein A6E03_16685 [Aliivibrio sp. 1S128]